jgi:galactonate dehydratase
MSPIFFVLEWHALEERAVWDSYVHVPNGGKSIVADGHIALPDAPGIGVELNLEGVQRHAVRGYGVFE